MLRRTSWLVLFAFVLAVAAAAARQDPIDRIREADLKADLFALAGDAMRGREGGTLDEMTASAWVAERAREAGLQPAGDNGTYFQFFPLERVRVSTNSAVTIGGKVLQIGRDVVPDAPMVASIDAPVIVAADETLTGLALSGRVLVVRYAPAKPADGPLPSLRTWLRAVQRTAASAAPSAIVALVPDEYRDQWDRVAITLPRGTYALNPDGSAVPLAASPRPMPLLYVRESALGAVAPDARVTASLFTDSFTYPSVNVVAKVPGRDTVLASQYVLFSAHQDRSLPCSTET